MQVFARWIPFSYPQANEACGTPHHFRLWRLSVVISFPMAWLRMLRVEIATRAVLFVSPTHDFPVFLIGSRCVRCVYIVR